MASTISESVEELPKLQCELAGNVNPAICNPARSDSTPLRTTAFSLQDFSFGLMIVGLKAFGFPITVPTFLLNWTMRYQPENTWRRDSSGLGIPLPSANHFMRQIIDGNGRPGPYLDKWIKAREGHPFYYPVKL
jgi:hypothetical protein